MTDNNIPSLKLNKYWEEIFQGETKDLFEKKILPVYIKRCRWFGSKARKIENIKITENIIIGEKESITHLLFLLIKYSGKIREMYMLPVTFSSLKENMDKINPRGIITYLIVNKQKGILLDGVYDEKFKKNLLLMIKTRCKIRGKDGVIINYPGEFLRKFSLKNLPIKNSKVLTAEQSNTSILYDKHLLFKLFRKLDGGMNPDLEIVKFISENTNFSNVPPFAGYIEYKKKNSKQVIMGMLQGFIPNRGDAWEYTVDSIKKYYEKILKNKVKFENFNIPQSIFATEQKIPGVIQKLIGQNYINMTKILGKRTGELHLALSSNKKDKNFSPEPITYSYQKTVVSSMKSQTCRVFGFLKGHFDNLKDNLKKDANEILKNESKIEEYYENLLKKKISATKIRIHDDYHLGQVLYTGKDFVIIDFEGEPARMLKERRLKKSPIKDISGMLRSFHYATYNALFIQSLSEKNVVLLEPWADIWYECISRVFLNSYFKTVKNASFIPKKKEDTETLLNAFLIEKAVYELGYELNNRPDWVIIPLKALRHFTK